MNRNTWIALALVVVAVGLFFALRPSAAPEVEPLQFGAVADLERIEIVPASKSEGPDLIVLERRGDGQWWIARPVEVPMDWRHAEQFQKIFARDLGTDDVQLDEERAESYGLADEQSVRLALFSAGQDRPAQELLVGREFEVVQTGARRTFVRRPGEATIHRAQAAFGDLVRLKVDELRDPTILAIGEEGIEEIHFRHHDGHEITLHHRDGQWQFAEGPAARVGLDEQRATRIASTLGRLRALGFPDESAEELGLDEPHAVVDVKTGAEAIRLNVVRIESDGEAEGEGAAQEVVRHFVVRDGEDEVFQVDADTGAVLMTRLNDVRSRSLIAGDSSSITELRLAGEDGAHLVRHGDRWQLRSPDGVELDPDRARRLAEFTAGLRVERWLQKTADEFDELAAEAAHSVTIGVDAEPTTLEFAPATGALEGRWIGRYSETDDLFVMSRSSVQRLQSSAADLGME